MSFYWLGMRLLNLSLIIAALLQTLSAELPQGLSEVDLRHEEADILLTEQSLAAAPEAQLQSEGKAVDGRRLSLNIKPELKTEPPLPQWCRSSVERKAGPWHQLSDDEYTNESPYLLCGLPEKGQRTFNVQRSSQRRAAHAVPNKGASPCIIFLASCLCKQPDLSYISPHACTIVWLLRV